MASQEPRIPTIDIEPLLVNSGKSYTDEDRAATASTLLKACKTHGLFFVVGHGITATQRKLAFDNARRFFSLPEATKRKIPAKKGGFTRGYIGFGGESGSHLLECKEAFSFGYPWPPGQPSTNALQGPNIWPEGDTLGEAWRDSMIALFRLMVSVNEAVARGLSLSPELGMLRGLPSLCQGGDTISLLRLFHYFPYSNDDSNDSDSEGNGDGGTGNGSSGSDRKNGGDDDGDSRKHNREIGGAGSIGSSPHTDWGLSTSILQDGAGGLQFLEQDTQRWVDVPCSREDALVFNCGDYLSLLSNGRLKSPVHQVVTTGVERTSFVFFYYPNFDAQLPTTPATAAAVATTTASSSTSAVASPAAAAAAAGTTAINSDGNSIPSAGRNDNDICLETNADSSRRADTHGSMGEAAAAASGGGTERLGDPEELVSAAAAAAAAAGTNDPPAKGITAETSGTPSNIPPPTPTPAAAAAKHAPEAIIGSYNTLLDLKRADADSSGSSSSGAPATTAEVAGVSFGQYLARKWGAVFRE